MGYILRWFLGVCMFVCVRVCVRAIEAKQKKNEEKKYNTNSMKQNTLCSGAPSVKININVMNLLRMVNYSVATDELFSMFAKAFKIQTTLSNLTYFQATMSTWCFASKKKYSQVTNVTPIWQLEIGSVDDCEFLNQIFVYLLNKYYIRTIECHSVNFTNGNLEQNNFSCSFGGNYEKKSQ